MRMGSKRHPKQKRQRLRQVVRELPKARYTSIQRKMVLLTPKMRIQNSDINCLDKRAI